MMEIDIYEQFNEIKSKQDFDFFLELLKKDFAKNKFDWENDTLERFLDALLAYSKTKGNELLPTWKLIAEFLLAAKVYE